VCVVEGVFWHMRAHYNHECVDRGAELWWWGLDGGEEGAGQSDDLAIPSMDRTVACVGHCLQLIGGVFLHSMHQHHSLLMANQDAGSQVLLG
jgi:hypothetical protein